MTEVLKGASFKWNSKAQQAFEEIKKKLSQALVLALACFEKMFEIQCYAFVVEIGEVLKQESCIIAYFSEKLRNSKRKYSTYDKQFCAIIQSIEHWNHYVIANVFALCSDYEALKYIEG